jgi:hypothetical protein
LSNYLISSGKLQISLSGGFVLPKSPGDFRGFVWPKPIAMCGGFVPPIGAGGLGKSGEYTGFSSIDSKIFPISKAKRATPCFQMESGPALTARRAVKLPC